MQWCLRNLQQSKRTCDLNLLIAPNRKTKEIATVALRSYPSQGYLIKDAILNVGLSAPTSHWYFSESSLCNCEKKPNKNKEEKRKLKNIPVSAGLFSPLHKNMVPKVTFALWFSAQTCCIFISGSNPLSFVILCHLCCDFVIDSDLDLGLDGHSLIPCPAIYPDVTLDTLQNLSN